MTKIKSKEDFFYYLIIITLFGFGILSLGFYSWAASQPALYKPKREVYVGVFREGAPANMNHIDKFAELAGKKPAMIMWYQDWAQTFSAEDAEKVIDYGAVPHIVWEPRYWSYPGKVKLKDIIAGKWDDYIRAWAKAIKALDQPIFLRVGHEFNVQVYPWGIVNNDKDADIYIKAYRRIVDIFKKEGAKNAKWIWCFNNYSNPDEPWNDWALAYPGDEYVDWIGIDGYNWGSTQSWSGWESFKGLFRQQMRRARKLWPSKPIMVAEFGSTEQGGDKAAWIKEIPGYLKTSMRDINAVIWFDLRKETDWRINSSKASQAAFQEIMQDPVFSSSGEALISHAAKAEKEAKKSATATSAPGVVLIDGKLSDWDKSYPISMKDSSYLKEGLDWGGPEDLSGSAYLMWDDVNLYLAAETVDNFPLVNKQSGQNIWNGDAIEIVMGLDPEADKGRASFGNHDYQIGFGVGDGKDNVAAIWNWQRRRTPPGSEVAVKKTSRPTGYILEAKIPWQFFRGKFAPAAGAKVDFDIAFDDADKTGERERQFIWNGDFLFYQDPSVWGILEFK